MATDSPLLITAFFRCIGANKIALSMHDGSSEGVGLALCRLEHFSPSMLYYQRSLKSLAKRSYSRTGRISSSSSNVPAA